MNNQQVDKPVNQIMGNMGKKDKKILIFVSLVLLVIASFFIWNKFIAGRLILSLEPSNAKAYVNNKPVLNTWDYRLPNIRTMKLNPGKHVLEIQAYDYETHIEIIDIKFGEPLLIEASLTPIYRELKLVVNPNNANIQITQNDKIIKSFTGSQVINELLEGDYEIVAHANGYKSYKGDFNIKNNQRTELSIVMNKEQQRQPVQPQKSLEEKMFDEYLKEKETKKQDQQKLKSRRMQWVDELLSSGDY